MKISDFIKGMVVAYMDMGVFTNQQNSEEKKVNHKYQGIVIEGKYFDNKKQRNPLKVNSFTFITILSKKHSIPASSRSHMCDHPHFYEILSQMQFLFQAFDSSDLILKLWKNQTITEFTKYHDALSIFDSVLNSINPTNDLEQIFISTIRNEFIELSSQMMNCKNNQFFFDLSKDLRNLSNPTYTSRLNLILLSQGKSFIRAPFSFQGVPSEEQFVQDQLDLFEREVLSQLSNQQNIIQDQELIQILINQEFQESTKIAINNNQQNQEFINEDLNQFSCDEVILIIPTSSPDQLIDYQIDKEIIERVYYIPPEIFNQESIDTDTEKDEFQRRRKINQSTKQIIGPLTQYQYENNNFFLNQLIMQIYRFYQMTLPASLLKHQYLFKKFPMVSSIITYIHAIVFDPKRTETDIITFDPQLMIDLWKIFSKVVPHSEINLDKQINYIENMTYITNLIDHSFQSSINSYPLQAIIRIIVWNEENQNKSSIADKLGIHRQEVYRILNMFNNHGSVEIDLRKNNKKQSIFTEEDKDALLEMIQNEELIEFLDIQERIKTELEIDVSRATIYRVLSEIGKFVLPSWSPISTLDHINQRLSFCKYHQNHITSFKHVIFTDECRFYVNRNTKKVFTLKDDQPPSKLKLNPDFSICVWGAISYQGALYIEVIEGKLNHEMYIEIQGRFFQQQDSNYGEFRTWHFQQDGAPLHKPQRVKDFILENGLIIHVHPRNSPDLNPIELIWGQMKQTIEKKILNQQELEDSIFQTWENLQLQSITNSIDTLKNKNSINKTTQWGVTCSMRLVIFPNYIYLISNKWITIYI
ncbi:hypothetical protein ABPG72_018364 [Tetrahymena utriculariae]